MCGCTTGVRFARYKNFFCKYFELSHNIRLSLIRFRGTIILYEKNFINQLLKLKRYSSPKNLYTPYTQFSYTQNTPAQEQFV